MLSKSEFNASNSNEVGGNPATVVKDLRYWQGSQEDIDAGRESRPE